MNLRPLSEALSHPVMFALIVPVLFACCGPFVKRLARGRVSWRRDDFYLGAEITLASISSLIFYAIDLLNASNGKIPLGLATPRSAAGFMGTFTDPAAAQAEMTVKLLQAMFFLVICFAVLLFLIVQHQDLVKRERRPVREILWRAILLNVIGFSTMIGFALLIKGID